MWRVHDVNEHHELPRPASYTKRKLSTFTHGARLSLYMAAFLAFLAARRVLMRASAVRKRNMKRKTREPRHRNTATTPTPRAARAQRGTNSTHSAFTSTKAGVQRPHEDRETMRQDFSMWKPFTNNNNNNSSKRGKVEKNR